MDRGHGGLTFEEFTKICTDQKSRDFSSSFKKKLSRNETVEKLGGVSEASNEGTYSMVSIKRPFYIKRPGLNFSQKSLLDDLSSLSQVLRASVHENQGNLKSLY